MGFLDQKFACPVNISTDITMGIGSHDALPPPSINFSFELVATQLWPPGYWCNQNSLTSTVFHRYSKGKGFLGLHAGWIVLDGHDQGTMLLHLTVPIVWNWLYAVIYPFSMREIQFSASTVKFNNKDVGCSCFMWPPLPMMTCSEPFDLPLAFPILNWMNTLKVGLSGLDLIMGWGMIAFSLVVDLIFFGASKLVKHLKLKKKVKDQIEKKVKKRVKKEIKERVEKEVKERIEKEVKKRVKKEIKKRVKKEVKERIEKEVKERVKKEVKDGMKKELKEKLKREIREQVEKELKEKLKREIREQVEKELKEKLKKEIREQVEKELKEKLKKEIREQVEKELKEKLEKEIGDRLEKEVKEKLEKEIRDRLEKKLKDKIKKELQDEMKKKLENKAVKEVILEKIIDKYRPKELLKSGAKGLGGLFLSDQLKGNPTFKIKYGTTYLGGGLEWSEKDSWKESIDITPYKGEHSKKGWEHMLMGEKLGK